MTRVSAGRLGHSKDLKATHTGRYFHDSFHHHSPQKLSVINTLGQAISISQTKNRQAELVHIE